MSEVRSDDMRLVIEREYESRRASVIADFRRTRAEARAKRDAALRELRELRDGQMAALPAAVPPEKVYTENDAEMSCISCGHPMRAATAANAKAFAAYRHDQGHYFDKPPTWQSVLAGLRKRNHCCYSCRVGRDYHDCLCILQSPPAQEG